MAALTSVSTIRMGIQEIKSIALHWEIRRLSVKVIRVSFNEVLFTLHNIPETVAPCSIGYTLVCGNVAPGQGRMADACPANLMTRSEDLKECACLPTRVVEQDLESGISPLGRKHQGCVKVESKMIFENYQGK